MKRSREDVNNGSFIISFGVAWDKLVFAKQTVFPVYDVQNNVENPVSPPPDSPGSPEFAGLLNGKNGRPPPELKAQRGVPPPRTDFTLRVTKGVNMNPPLMLKIVSASPPKKLKDELCLDESRETAKLEEEVRLSLVGPDAGPIPTGFCSCSGYPVLRESRPHQFPPSSSSSSSFTCSFKGDTLYFEKLQIGCCTGSRGHGTRFCLKIEFIKRDSPLFGRVALSLPIEVGSKSPFAPSPSSYSDRLSPGKGLNAAGCEEVSNILRRVNLDEYVDVFLDNEIDLEAFCKLRENELRSMGITKVGPCVKILNEVTRTCERMAVTLPPPSSPLPSAYSLSPAVTTSSSSSPSPTVSSPVPGYTPGTPSDPSTPHFPQQQLSSFLSAMPTHIPVTNLPPNMGLNFPPGHFSAPIAALPSHVQHHALAQLQTMQPPQQQQQQHQQHQQQQQLQHQNPAANLPAHLLQALLMHGAHNQPQLWDLVNPFEFSAFLQAQLQSLAQIQPQPPPAVVHVANNSTTNHSNINNSTTSSNPQNSSSPPNNFNNPISMTFHLTGDNDSNSNMLHGSSTNLHNLHTAFAGNVHNSNKSNNGNSSNSNSDCDSSNNGNNNPQYLFY